MDIAAKEPMHQKRVGGNKTEATERILLQILGVSLEVYCVTQHELRHILEFKKF